MNSTNDNKEKVNNTNNSHNIINCISSFEHSSHKNMNKINNNTKDISTSLIDGFQNKNKYLDIKEPKTYWSYVCDNSGNNKLDRLHKFSSVDDKPFNPCFISYVPRNMDINDFENLIRKKRLEDINNIIEKKDYLCEYDRETGEDSPEPIYDSDGRRINSRENMCKFSFITERNNIIEELILYNEGYEPPEYYVKNKKRDIIFIKNNDKYLFTKYLIGYKGEHIKELECITECKISIKGKGSNFNKKHNIKNNDEFEFLHILIEGDTDDIVKKAKIIINKYLDPNSAEYNNSKNIYNNMCALSVSQNNPACEFCGLRGHSSWFCPSAIKEEKSNIINVEDKGEDNSRNIFNNVYADLYGKDLIKDKYNDSNINDNNTNNKNNNNENNEVSNKNDNNDKYDKIMALNKQKIKLMKKFKTPGIYNNFIKEGNAIEYNKKDNIYRTGNIYNNYMQFDNLIDTARNISKNLSKK